MSDNETLGHRTVTAFFDGESDANTAVKSLHNAGIDQASVRLVEGRGGDLDASAHAEVHRGFLQSLSDFFMSDEDRHSYAEGLTRGGYLVTVTGLNDTDYNTAVEILDREGAVDFDEREEEWRTDGWSSYAAKPAAEETVASATVDDVIPVVSEELQVGKRDVNLGSVRVRSYVREEPVSQQINLRDERVTLERRPVDRPLNATDDAFAERTIVAEEHSEQAVVAKVARVTEKIALRKDTVDRQETVTDTVRRTEVEIEDERNLAQGAKPTVRRP